VVAWIHSFYAHNKAEAFMWEDIAGKLLSSWHGGNRERRRDERLGTKYALHRCVPRDPLPPIRPHFLQFLPPPNISVNYDSINVNES
jgi:hypothetical protein